MGNSFQKLHPVDYIRKPARVYTRACRRCDDLFKSTGKYGVYCNKCKKDKIKICLRCNSRFNTNNKYKRNCPKCDTRFKKENH